MKRKAQSHVVVVLSLICVIRTTAAVAATTHERGFSEAYVTGVPTVAVPQEPVVIAWCRAMGGYASFEAQARAEAQQRKTAARQADEARRSAASAQVRTDQQLLKDLGYYRGRVDGRVGPATTTAISQFRVANNLGAGTTLDVSSRQVIASDTAVRKMSAEPSTSRGTLRKDQQALADLGYYKGPVDGIPGPLTRSAIREFKAAHGFDPTSHSLDDATRTRLAELSAGRSTQ